MYITWPEAYDTIWGKLEAHYDAYCQLQELNHLNILTMRDVDHGSEFLPSHSIVEWTRIHQDMSPAEKLNPFPHFMKFMKREREAVA